MSPAARAIAGVGTALVTPFHGTALDRKALARFVAAQVDAGVDFLVPCGTTGESPTLSDAERRAVVETVVEAAAGRVPVVAGTSTYNTAHSVHLTKEARAAGADAALVVAPYYNRPTQEGIYRHVRAIADEGGLEVVLYHIPSRCGVGIDVATVQRLVAKGGILGLKETETIARMAALREAVPDLSILSGDDGLTLPMMALGARGTISVASNVVPGLVVDLVRAMEDGRLSEARGVHERLLPLVRALFLESNPTPVKAALQMTDSIPEDGVRLPLVPASAATRRALHDALVELGVARL